MYEDDTSFTNSSTVNNNLDYFIKKYKKIRVVSPVIIQSYGNNNFAIELINEIRNNNNYQFENELDDYKYKKKYKTKTNLTDISPGNINTFYNTKGTERFVKYKNYTNINENNYMKYNNISYISEDKYSPKNKTIIDDKVYNNQLFKKEEVDDIFYPSKSNFTHKKNKTDLQYQRYSSSFIPKANKLQKKAVNKCNIIKQVKLKSQNKTPSLSKSKNQLEEFNIDKLKEIGDHLSIKLINGTNHLKINKYNANNSRNNINIKSVTEDKDKQNENEFINNMMKIDQKRKNSKNKLIIINRVKNSFKMKDLFNTENEKKNHIRTKNDNFLVNSPPNKLVRKTYKKSKELINDNSQRYIKKIKVNGKFMRNEFKLKPLKSFNHVLKTTNLNMNNTCKNNYKKNINYQIYYHMNNTNINEFSNKENQNTFCNDKNICDINFYNQNNIFYNNQKNVGLRRKSSNYSYLGAINFKNNKKINECSFNNIFLH